MRITEHLFRHSSSTQPLPIQNYDESKMCIIEQHLISSQKQYAIEPWLIIEPDGLPRVATWTRQSSCRASGSNGVVWLRHPCVRVRAHQADVANTCLPGSDVCWLGPKGPRVPVWTGRPTWLTRLTIGFEWLVWDIYHSYKNWLTATFFWSSEAGIKNNRIC